MKGLIVSKLAVFDMHCELLPVFCIKLPKVLLLFWNSEFAMVTLLSESIFTPVSLSVNFPTKIPSKIADEFRIVNKLSVISFVAFVVQFVIVMVRIFSNVQFPKTQFVMLMNNSLFNIRCCDDLSLNFISEVSVFFNFTLRSSMFQYEWKKVMSVILNQRKNGIG